MENAEPHRQAGLGVPNKKKACDLRHRLFLVRVLRFELKAS